MVMYVAFAVPYRIAFAADPDPSSAFFYIEISIDCLFILDVAKNFRTYVSWLKLP